MEARRWTRRAGTQNGDIGLRPASLPADRPDEIELGLLNEKHRPLGSQTGQQMLGALVNEVPAEMGERDDRVARQHEKLLRGEWNSCFGIRVGVSLWQTFLSRSSPAAPASSSLPVDL